MTRDDLVRQVMGRAKMAERLEGQAHEVLNLWLKMWPQKFVFGTHEVMAGCRLVRRELGLK